MTTEKPFASVYKWVGFFVFWGVLLVGIIDLAFWLYRTHVFISTMYPL